MMMRRPYLTVLMPAYNEEACLRESVEAVLAKLAELHVDAELLVVDDCSCDGTGALAEELVAQHAQVRVVHHSVNLGIGGGFRTGIQEARGDWMILIPADLALDLDELPKYFDATQYADLVVGIRSDRRDYSLFRLVLSWINIHAIHLLFGMKQRQFNYISMYRLALLRRIDIQYWHSAFFYAEAMIKVKALGGQLVEVNINYVPRCTGRATGARLSFVLHTSRDMLHFWLSQAFSLPKRLPIG